MIEKTISKYKNKSFLIAYSGGLDSTVLLHQLLEIKKKYSIKIRAIHINHNLTLLSKKWTEHCKKICDINSISLIIENININKKTSNIEEKLRIKRYNIIYNHLFFDEILLTGHHMNDQCETFILSLKRGSGPTGLSSMSFETLFGTKKIVRPFLNKTKKELMFWAKKKHLHWIEDFSNLNIDYDRNFVRHTIIPVLEKRWPYFLKNCFRTTNICQQETRLLNYFLHEKIHDFIQFDDSLNIKDFKNIKKEICTALIRYWLLSKKIKIPSYKNIQCIYHQMIFSRIDANPKIILEKYEIRRYKESLYFIKKQINLKNTLLFWHKKYTKLILPNNLGNLIKDNNGIELPAPKNNELINIRFQYEGYVLILGRNKKRKIKKIWQEKKIPPWLRNQIPLVFYNNNFISALGVFIININNKNRGTWKISWESDLKSAHNDLFSFY
ncbi:cell cycle protein MesJ [Buchnera aphidicola str. Ak (Acyrthosiphon kondoi)]|uniref:tRNA(Ile)-lysidine synthase n=1 Tax=Buchnera aphidicola str. Ak (Acyrthosiphon kondoi) TaxID=1005090 RepID=G2LMI5_9GAMM|nr:tRNA lysidine(34) synthetase TilS [Buchnera aphidicola]AEO08473.1 cell cycle protein MesJ [Buchnera aphidicola str. Ak (Acyrthosiphon kondoi)]WAI18171.1 MAG: tRNA lysidine(34) synthetase TilS [Buchnera aphidicola (Acyrthosiphon caraganae)]